MTKGLWNVDRQIAERTAYLKEEGIIAKTTTDKIALPDYWLHISPGLQLFFPLAIRLADLVGLTHEQHLIPHPFSPRSILVDLNHGGLSYHPLQTFVPFEEANFFLRPEEAEAGWYLAPEQIGQVQFLADYRCTIYTLGLFFYEMLAGQHPFKEHDDAVARMHAHLARRPVSLYDLKPSIPLTLSTIVDKMLAKQPDERYQSAYGLKADLKRAYHEWQTQGYISYFQPGEEDRSVSLRWNDRLIGREKEMKVLHEAFTWAGENDPVLVSVTGAAGVGKSALIDHFCRRLAYAHIIYVKCEQLKTNIPYATMIKILKQFFLKKIAQGENQIQKLRESLKEMPEFNHAILAQILPEINLILGPPPPYQALPPAESETRFRSSIQSVFQVMLADEPFWVLIMDDLQWIDEHSLHLFDQLFLHVMPVWPVMVIGARRQEVPIHIASRLNEWANWFKTKGKSVGIQLNSLDLDHLTHWCTSLFHCSAQDAVQVARPVHYKTLGNPLFIRKVLQELYDQRCLYFDHRQGKWSWDLAAIESHKASDNIVTLIQERIARLSDQEQLCLKVAACIGIHGDYDVLARVVPPDIDLEMYLDHCQQLGIVTVSLIEENEDSVKMTFSFSHDQIWQTIFLSVSDAEKEEFYGRIGRVLLEDFHGGKGVNVPEMVRYLNFGQKSVKDPAERVKMARLNLQAAQHMKDAIAYQTAIQFLEQASLWVEGIEEKELSFTIQMELAHCYYLAHRFTEAEAITEQLVQSAPSLVHKMRIYELKIIMYRHFQKYEEGIKIGILALKEMGVSLPKRVSTWRLAAIGLWVRRMLPRHVLTKPNRPRGPAPEKDVILIRLFEELSDLLYMIDPKLYAYLTLKMLVKMIKGELLADSPLLYINFALMCIRGLGNIELAEWASRVALRLVKYEREFLRGHVYFVRASFVHFWSNPYATSLPELDEAFDVSIKNGNYHVAMGPVTFKLLIKLFQGVPLSRLMEDVTRYRDIFRKLNIPLLVDWLNELQHNLHHLQGAQPGKIAVKLEEKKDFALYNSDIHLMVLYVPQLMILYMTEEFDLLCEEGQKIETLMREQADSIFSHVFYFFYALGLVEIYPHASKTERKKLKACLRMLKKLAKRSPKNGQLSYLLISAEWLRLQGNNGKAFKRYRQAVEALDEQSGHLAAVVYERKGHFEWQLGLKHTARITLNEAYKQYHQWGIEAKKAALLDRYGALLTLSNRSMVTSPASMIDHLSLIKASQDLSKEIDFKRLVVKLLQNTIQNAGAQKGTLILYQNGRWQIEAEAILEQNGAFSSRLPGHLFDFYQGIPRLLIQYVMKTKKTWVSEDASRDSLFEKDTYIREQRPRSLLCTPILHQGELIGILYLENNLFKGAFTEDKVLTVQLLATQAAISLINARLYEEMKALNQQLEEKVKERTASLHRSQQETMRMVAERAVLEERQRLSKEIHDVIGHSLTVAIVQLETVRRLIQANQSSQAQQALVTSLQLIRKGQQEVRRSIRMLGEEDIAFNLEHEIDQLIHQTEATADVVVQKHIGRLPPLGLKQKRVIYQALMEGLTNGIRHARAKEFSLDLDWDGQMVIFQLQNDGEIRIPVKYGFGLTSMSHAIEELGGSMHVTADQHTFQLDIRLPWVQSGIL